MFTGIIEEVGEVLRVDSIGGGIRMRISAPGTAKDLSVNDSVSINGACHTVVTCDGDSFAIESVEETLLKTALGSLGPRSKVNLELPLRLNERLGGHLVLGHVDTAGRIMDIEERTSSWMFRISFPADFSHYIVRTGSITVDGVSLTVAEIGDESIRVSIIPHTRENTIFQFYQVGDTVNIEFDVIGKYLERLLKNGMGIPTTRPSLDENYLREQGY